MYQRSTDEKKMARRCGKLEMQFATVYGLLIASGAQELGGLSKERIYPQENGGEAYCVPKTQEPASLALSSRNHFG